MVRLPSSAAVRRRVAPVPIDQRAGFALGGARRESREQDAGTAGTGVTANFCHGAAGKAARQGIEWSDPGGNTFKNTSLEISGAKDDGLHKSN